MKIKILVSLLLFISSVVFSNTVFIKDRMDTVNFYKNSYDTLFGDKVRTDPEIFNKAFSNVNGADKYYAKHFIKIMNPYIESKLLMPLVYWRYVNPNKKNEEQVLSYYLLYKFLILRDFIDHPLYGSEMEKAKVKDVLLSLAKNLNPSINVIDTFSMYKKLMPEIRSAAKYISDKRQTAPFLAAFQQVKIAGFDIPLALPFVQPYVLSFMGFIPGNKIEIVSENQRGVDRINWVNERVTFNGGTLDWDAPYMQMPKGPNDPNGHICFKQDPIFMRIREMIDRAKDSIFIDIFLFGGTLGGTIAKYLIEQTIEKRKVNPNFKTLILHDFATNYNMKPEMMPIFEYIRDKIKEGEDEGESIGVMLLQANIQRHPPGVPFGISNLIQKTEENFERIEEMNTYFESKIDHSKVVVIDANTDSPAAYFGSKNWADHSGAYYYDDAIYIEGPAAALVQYSYYDDIDAALTTDPEERKWFYFKDEGFGNIEYFDRRDEILSWFQLKRNSYPSVGNEPTRLAYANVDGKIKNVRNILIDMIMSAEDHIYMEHLFIYDKYINDALLKKKNLDKNIDIRILADHNRNFGMNGFPNTIFMKELIDSGIQIKARNTEDIEFTFPNGEKRVYHQENHRKATAIDGKVFLGGSSNLNPDTLQGSFGEFGAQVFNIDEIKQFEDKFLEDWDNPEMTSPFDIENFEMILFGKPQSQDTSALINDAASWLMRSKGIIEKRH